MLKLMRAIRRDFLYRGCCNCFFNGRSSLNVSMRLQQRSLSNSKILLRCTLPHTMRSVPSEKKAGGNSTEPFDFMDLLHKTQSVKEARLNLKEFVGPVAVDFISEAKGKGFFATQPIQPGQLLMAAKAIEFVFHSELADGAKEIVSHHGLAHDLQSIGERDAEDRIVSVLTERLMAKAERKQLPSDVLNLYAGVSLRKILDELSPLSTENSAEINERLRTIVKFNSFGEGRDEEYGSAFLAVDSISQDQSGLGLWQLPSFLNHSCLPNAISRFFGDFLFVRAIKPIAAGDEITINYAHGGLSLDERQRFLARYDFQCDCRLCEGERNFCAHFPKRVEEREEVMSQFERTLQQQLADALNRQDQNPKRRRAKEAQAHTQLLNELLKFVDNFRSTLAFTDRFDHSLFCLLTALGDAYLLNRMPVQAVTVLEQAYRSLWWELPGKRRHSPELFLTATLNTDAVILALKIALLCESIGPLNKLNALKWFRKSFEGFRILYGPSAVDLDAYVYFFVLSSEDEQVVRHLHNDLYHADLFSKKKLNV